MKTSESILIDRVTYCQMGHFCNRWKWGTIVL